MGQKVIPLSYFIKNFFTAMTLVALAVFIPPMVRHDPEPARVQYPEVAVQVAGDEVKIAELEAKLKYMEEQKIGEQLTELKTQQRGIFVLLIPIVLSMLTRAWEDIERMRGNTRSRSTDRARGKK